MSFNFNESEDEGLTRAKAIAGQSKRESRFSPRLRDDGDGQPVLTAVPVAKQSQGAKPAPSSEAIRECKLPSHTRSRILETLSTWSHSEYADEVLKLAAADYRDGKCKLPSAARGSAESDTWPSDRQVSKYVAQAKAERIQPRLLS